MSAPGGIRHISDASTLHFRREEISHRYIRRCVGNDQHGRRDLDEPHHFTSPNRQASDGVNVSEDGQFCKLLLSNLR
jgi:hypothetical protein